VAIYQAEEGLTFQPMPLGTNRHNAQIAVDKGDTEFSGRRAELPSCRSNGAQTELPHDSSNISTNTPNPYKWDITVKPDIPRSRATASFKGKKIGVVRSRHDGFIR